MKTLKKQAEALAAKLEQVTDRVRTEPLICEYDNGGGQSGTRENPFFPAYEKLLSSYVKTLAAISEMEGKQPQETAGSLEALRNRFKVTA